jgi:hypothetical protein
MKKVIYTLVALLAFTACKKEANQTKTIGEGAGSIVLDQSPTANSGSTARLQPYTSQDSTIVLGLMSSNNLSVNGFAFYTYQSYNALDQNNQMGFYQIAEARQVRNGLPVFFEDITFGFENGKLVGTPPAPQFIAANIALDNKPNQSLQSLRTTFITTDNSREAQSIAIQDSTLAAQLGYYDLNLNNTLSGGTPNYIKMWFIHPQHWPLPTAYIRDDTGELLSFTPLTHSGPLTP